VNGGKLVTDVTNASRTMLMNLATKSWDINTCKELGIPVDCLLSISSNSEDHGNIQGGALSGVMIGGVCLL